MANNSDKTPILLAVQHKMKISHENNINGYFIRSYSPERITIAYPGQTTAAETPGTTVNITEETLESSFILTAQTLIRDWAPQSITDLSPSHCEQLASLKPELIVLGTGNKIQFPDAAWSAGLFEQGIGLEIMDTGAACRTFSILAADGRNVAAALIIN